MTLLFFPDLTVIAGEFLLSFDTPHCSILKKPWGDALSCFAFCEQSCEGRFHVFSSPIKNTIQSFLLSFHTQNEVLTKMSLCRFFWVELKFKCLKAFHSQYLANSHRSARSLSAMGLCEERVHLVTLLFILNCSTLLSQQPELLSSV